MATDELVPQWSSRSFVHTSLSDPRNQIRLLRSTGGEDGLHFEMAATELKTCPAYLAISYTWGNPRDLRNIRVNGATMTVRQNCYEALSQVLLHEGSTYIWIDSICINQSDDDEKTHQVRMMGSIYAGARHAFVCIGAQDENSRLVYNLIREPGIRGPPYGSAPDRYVHAMHQFGNREYWTRLWIIQECLLARQISILCGSECAHIDALMQCIDTVMASYIDDEFEVPYELEGTFMSVVLKCRRGGRRPPRIAFEDAMFSFFETRCFDSRDKIFGLAAVLEWSGVDRGAIEVDYAMDIGTVTGQALLRCSNNDVVHAVLKGLNFAEESQKTSCEFARSVVTSCGARADQELLAAIFRCGLEDCARADLLQDVRHAFEEIGVDLTIPGGDVGSVEEDVAGAG